VKRFAGSCEIHLPANCCPRVAICTMQLVPSSETDYTPGPKNHKGEIVTPNDELKQLDAELERLQDDHSNATRVLRLTDKCLRRCSAWKWEQHGWIISDGQSCGVRNGNERARRTALMSVLKEHIHEIEFVSGLERLEVVLGPSGAEHI
jgi:hypothetical protein